MKPLTLISLLILLIWEGLFAQTLVSGQVTKNFESHNISRFKVFEEAKDFLGLQTETEMKLIRSFKDKRGKHHDRYHQFYKNIIVEGASSVVHSNLGFAESITGYLENRLENLPFEPTLSENAAISIANQMMNAEIKEEHKINTKQPINPKTEQVSLCYINEFYPKNHGKVVLAYKILQSINIWSLPVKKVHYINAMTGSPIKSINKIATHRAKGKGLSNYYGEVSFDHDSINPNEFHLRDYSRGAGVFIINNKTAEGYKNQSPSWNYSDPNDKAAIDVMYGAQNFYDLLKTKFDFNSIDNKGYPLIGKVNNYLYSNAYWDGEATTYGGGDCHDYKSFTTIDVVGHEFAHGFTEFNSGLIYNGESGAINESISDIFGKALEFYTQPSQFSWFVGHKIPKPAKTPFRLMSNPNAMEHPKYYKGQFWSNSTFSVHTNSGVMNYWFYLLVKGGKSKNEKDVSFDVKPIGMDKALEIVFLLNTAYLIGWSEYSDVYDYSKLIVEEIYGIDSDEYNSLIEAWKAVGLPSLPENKELTLTSATNGDYDLNPFECWEETNTMILSFTNNSTITIPPGALFNIRTVAEYDYDGIKQFVTIVDSTLNLTDSIRYNESVHLETSLSTPASVEYVLLRKMVKIIFEGKSYNNTFIQSIKYLKNAEDPKDYFKANFLASSIENICDNKSKALTTYASIAFNLCRSESYIFEFVYEDGTISKSFNYLANVIPNRFFNFIYISINNPDLSIFPNTKNIIAHLNVIIDGQKYHLKSESLSDHFLEPLQQDFPITFDQLDNFRDEKRLNTIPCFDCETKLISDVLNLKNKYRRTKINDCVDINAYYDSVSEDPFSLFSLASIKGCANTQNMTNPHLSFEAKLTTTTDVTNSNYRHGITVFENDQRIIIPVISDTGKELKKFEVPISSLPNLPFNLKIWLDGAEVSLDNISIFDKTNTNTDNVQDELPYYIPNPTSDKVQIFWKSQSYDYNTIQIFDNNGNGIFSGNLSGAFTEIDCSSWSPGFYVFKLQAQEKIWYGKLIVVR